MSRIALINPVNQAEIPEQELVDARSDAEKAQQLPEPAGWKLLCALP